MDGCSNVFYKLGGITVIMMMMMMMMMMMYDFLSCSSRLILNVGWYLVALEICQTPFCKRFPAVSERKNQNL